jgi:hypothetical protein
VSIVNQTGFAGLHFDPTYTANALNLTADALGGDANLDGLVNLSDFNALAANFGQDQRTWLEADFNGDGQVNLTDFNILASNFGMTAGPTGPTPQDWSALSAVVPEPSLAHLVILLAGGAQRRMRRASTRRAASRP